MKKINEELTLAAWLWEFLLLDNLHYEVMCAHLNTALHIHLTLNPSPEGEGLSSIEAMVASNHFLT